MTATKFSAIFALAALLLAGCAVEQTRIEADPVIGGRAYPGKPIDLGRLKMIVALQPQIRENDKFVTDPEQLDIVLGFLAAGEPASVVVSAGRLASLRTGHEAQLATRFQAQGNAQGCGGEPLGELSTDYWFNARADATDWKCALLRFRLPGHEPGEPLELRIAPVNVGGELVRVLPVSFAYRIRIAGEDKPEVVDLQTCRMSFGMHPDTADRRRQERERICKRLEAEAAAQGAAQ